MAAPLFELHEIDQPDVWDQLVASSKQGKVFSSSAFLNALQLPSRRFVITSSAQPVALLCAVENQSGDEIIAPDFTPYQGILFLDQTSTLDRTRILDEFRITEYLSNEITRRYRSATIRLSWTFNDVRPFQWHNYGGDEAARFRITPYYTATLGLTGKSESDLLSELRPCRRQELRKARELLVVEEDDLCKFESLYRDTFLRQNISVSDDKIALAKRLCEAAVENKFGRLTACYKDKQLAGMALFVFDARRGYYLFGANDPNFRNSGASTKLVWENIKDLRSRGLAEADFVGVNSPLRGDFKLSFNPKLRMYFQAEYGSQRR